MFASAFVEVAAGCGDVAGLVVCVALLFFVVVVLTLVVVRW